jgi:predicted HTH domain antitoxin
MHTLTAEELKDQPQRLLDDARNGQGDIVLIEGEPAMLTMPLGANAGTPAALLELAVALYEADQISLGRAAEVAGLAYSQMIDELGSRGIPVVRYSVEDLDRELAYVGTLAGSR